VLSLSILILAKDPTCVGPQYLSNILMQNEFHNSDDKSMLCKVGTVHPNMKWVIMEMVRVWFQLSLMSTYQGQILNGCVLSPLQNHKKRKTLTKLQKPLKCIMVKTNVLLMLATGWQSGTRPWRMLVLVSPGNMQWRWFVWSNGLIIGNKKVVFWQLHNDLKQNWLSEDYIPSFNMTPLCLCVPKKNLNDNHIP